MKFLLPKLSLIVFIFLLSACGGGGGNDGGGTTSPAPPNNVAPITDAGIDKTADEETAVSLTGSAMDADGTIASYAWSQTSGQAVTLVDSDTATASFSAPVTTTQLSLIFQFTATDNNGTTSSDLVVITINPVNVIPIASAGIDQTVYEKTNVTLSGNASDTDGVIASYNWIQTAGISVSINNESTAESSFTAPITTTQMELIFQLTVTDNDGAATSDSVVITVNPAVNVTIEEATVDIVTVSSGVFGEVEVVDGIVSIDITKITDEGLVTAYDADDNIIWLGHIKAGDETIALNGRSTAQELMLLVPNIAVFNSSQPDVFISYFNDSQEINILITYLSDNNDWYQMPQEFSDLYSAAVLSIFNRINIGNSKSTSKSKSKSRIPNHGIQKAVVVVAEDNNGLITTNYTQAINGIEVKVNHLIEVGKEGLFSIEVTNKLNRWVGIAVGPDPENYSGAPFPTSSSIASYIYKGKNDTARFEDELLKLDDVPDTTSYGVYIYGPALDDFWGGYQAGRFANDLHGNATAYTLLFEIAVPVFGRAIGGKSCLQQMFDPTRQTYSIAASIISNPNIQAYLSNKEVDNAALEIGILIANSIATTGSDCLKEIALKQLQKLIPMIGQIQAIADLIANINTVDDVYDTLAKSNSKTFWEVSNRINMSFYMEGVGHIPLVGNYLAADKIPSSYISKYPGECIDDTTTQNICDGFIFAKGTPKVIAYTLKCIDPVTEAITRCKSGVVEPDMIDLIPEPDGTLRFTIDYSDTGDKEYSHIFKVYDDADAENQYTASVQIQTAVPQLVYRIDGQEFDTALNTTGHLSNVTPYIIDTHGAASKTVTVEVYNKGLGEAEINQIGPILGSTHFTFSNYSTAFTNSPIALGESRTFDVTYTPLSSVSEEASISLYGVKTLLGDENLLTSSIGFKQYTRMDLHVEGNTSGPEIKVVLNKSEVPSSATLVAYDYGTIQAYAEQPISLTISNVGTESLRLNIDRRYPNTILDLNNGVDIEPGGSITVNGTYFANTLGSTDEIISIVNNDADEGVYQLLLHSNVILPDPPKFIMSPIQCVGNNSFLNFDYRIESTANGSWTTNLVLGGRWNYNDSVSYSGTTVDCWFHMFRSLSGGTFTATLTDEFGQVFERSEAYSTCPTENPPFEPVACTEYYGN